MKRWSNPFALLVICLLPFGYLGYLGIHHSEKAAHAQNLVTFTEFPLPQNSILDSITAGPDGNLWFTLFRLTYGTPSDIGRITPNGTISLFPMPSTNNIPGSIITGPDGNLWFTDNSGTTVSSSIGRITPSGVITEFALGSGRHRADDITAGPDGNLWFIDDLASAIGRITTVGAVAEFPVPSIGVIGFINQITKGPDGNLWFTNKNVGKIGRITPQGVVTEFPVSLAGNSLSDPGAIAGSPNGNIWFTFDRAIGQVTPTGTATMFPIPNAGIDTFEFYTEGITAGPSGSMWFTEPSSFKIGSITPSGSITEYSLPAHTYYPGNTIVTGPDGNLWYTEISTNTQTTGSPAIGRMNLSSTPPSQPKTYVALGDSYSSGEGNPPFNANQDCDRSYNAWPYLLAKSDTSVKLLANVACAGAKASNALNGSYNPCFSIHPFICPQPPQIPVMKALKPDLLTITIGGNDIGFASTLRGCYLQGIAHLQNLCVGRLYSQVAVINSLQKEVVSYYKEIKAALPSTSKVYVIGYPNLFPTNQKNTIHCGWLSNAGRVEFNNLAILLDRVLHNAANAAGINYISTLYALKGHELCTSNSWINPIVSTNRTADLSYDGHPTLPGQQAIETIVDANIHQ